MRGVDASGATSLRRAVAGGGGEGTRAICVPATLSPAVASRLALDTAPARDTCLSPLVRSDSCSSWLVRQPTPCRSHFCPSGFRDPKSRPEAHRASAAPPP